MKPAVARTSTPATSGAKIDNDIIIFDLERGKERLSPQSEARISLAIWRARLHPPAKMPCRCLDQSKPRLQDRAFRQRHREIRALASGASARESEGWRRSQSNKMTRAPPCAMSVAIAAASSGFALAWQARCQADNLLSLVPVELFRSTVSLIERMASAYGDDGESTIVRMIFGAEQMLLAACSVMHQSTQRLMASSKGLPSVEKLSSIVG